MGDVSTSGRTATTTTTALWWSDSDCSRHPFVEKTSLNIMGCLMSTDVLEPVKHRLARAEIQFWTHKSFFCSTVISWERKVLEFVKRVKYLALYGATLWTWTPSVHSFLRAWEGRMLRYMMRTSWRRDGESFGEWRRRHNRLVRKMLIDCGAEELPEAALRRQFRWASTAIARFARDLLRQTSRRSWPSLDTL